MFSDLSLNKCNPKMENSQFSYMYHVKICNILKPIIAQCNATERKVLTFRSDLMGSCTAHPPTSLLSVFSLQL